MFNLIKNWFTYKPIPHRKIEVHGFTLILVDRHEFNNILDVANKERYMDRDINGCCYIKHRVIYVAYDDNLKDLKGNPMPRLETLGHEVAHLPEIAGSWHD